MIQYVLGFAFSEDGSQVLLINKNRPDWQAGKLNGIGGKVENNEAIIDAMVREFREETTLNTTPGCWQLFLKMNSLHDNTEVYCYRMSDDFIQHAESVTDEPVGVYLTDEAHQLHTLPSVRILLPMALDNNLEYSEINYRSKS